MTSRPLTSTLSAALGSTLQRVASIIEWGFGAVPTAIHADTLFREDLGIDEIAFVLVVAAVEEDFSVQLPDSRAMQMRSVGDLVSWLDAPAPARVVG